VKEIVDRFVPVLQLLAFVVVGGRKRSCEGYVS